MKNNLTTSLIALGSLAFASLACAQDQQTSPPSDETEPAPAIETTRARQSGVFTIYFENDYFGGTDQNYSNGVKLSWLTDDLTEWGQFGWRRGFLDHLPFINKPGTQKNFGFSFGQNIYTPEDTNLVNPNPADRPYAGWSYVELSFISKTDTRADILSIQAGIVGPSSLAQDTQRIVHEAIDDDVPRGWDHQLKDEPGINLIYERRHRLIARTLGDTLGFDFIPHGGFSLGNVQTYANIGGTVRLGINLPSDFGVGLSRGGSIGAAPSDDSDPRVAVNRDISVFVFAGTDGRAVARDIFLDGNTWKDSRSVDKEPFVADFMVGFGVIVGRWQLTGTMVERTREFETQDDSSSRFGSVTLSVAF